MSFSRAAPYWPCYNNRAWIWPRHEKLWQNPSFWERVTSGRETSADTRYFWPPHAGALLDPGGSVQTAKMSLERECNPIHTCPILLPIVESEPTNFQQYRKCISHLGTGISNSLSSGTQGHIPELSINVTESTADTCTQTKCILELSWVIARAELWFFFFA